MPYLQVDLDAKKRVPHVARALGMSEHQAGWGLVNLWEWCWSEKRDKAHAAHLAGFFGARGTDVAAVLEAFGFLESTTDGYRVRGAERYLRLTEAWSAGGKKSAGNLKRGAFHPRPGAQPGTGPGVEPGDSRDTSRETAPALTPNTEHRTPITKRLAGTDVPRRVKADKQTDPRHAPLVKALVEVSPGYAFGGRDARAVSDLLAKAEPQEILRRWKAALAHKGFPTVRAIHELVTHWNHFKQDKSEEYIDATHMSQDELYPEEA